MRKISHGAKIVLQNNRYTTPVTFEFVPARKMNQSNVFESYKKVFAVIKMIDNTTKIITKKGKLSNIPNPSLKDKNISSIYPLTMKYIDRGTFLSEAKWNHPS